MNDKRKENEKKRIPPLRFTELVHDDVQDHVDDLCCSMGVLHPKMQKCVNRFVRTFE